MPSLLTETNTVAVERKVMSLAAKRLNRIHHHLTTAFEHGQWWVLCSDCGASWSVVDAEPGPLDFERIDTGDESCFSRTGGGR